jgi:hypothetical protein
MWEIVQPFVVIDSLSLVDILIVVDILFDREAGEEGASALFVKKSKCT